MKVSLLILYSLLQPIDIMYSLRVKLSFNNPDSSFKNAPEIYSTY
jgi:hypothetical protein